MPRMSTRTHGMIDYLAALLLILLPWVVGFQSDRAIWTLVAAGVVVLLTALMTNYELGLVHLVPMQAHLGLDVVVGLFLIASPWLFGFAGNTWTLHVILGLLEIGGAAMTERSPARDRVSHADPGR